MLQRASNLLKYGQFPRNYALAQTGVKAANEESRWIGFDAGKRVLGPKLAAPIICRRIGSWLKPSVLPFRTVPFEKTHFVEKWPLWEYGTHSYTVGL